MSDIGWTETIAESQFEDNLDHPGKIRWVRKRGADFRDPTAVSRFRPCWQTIWLFLGQANLLPSSQYFDYRGYPRVIRIASTR